LILHTTTALLPPLTILKGPESRTW
jgi:hypothetical protein